MLNGSIFLNKKNVINFIMLQLCTVAFVANSEQFSWQGKVPTQTTSAMQAIILDDNQYQNLQINHEQNWLYFDIKKAAQSDVYIKLLTVRI